MRGFVLAAGFGTRLRPLTEHIPKALVPVAGIPLIGHALSFLSTNGITKIGANSHYLSEMIELYRQKSTIPFTLFNEIGAIRGTGGALHFARDFLSKDGDFFVTNVDILARYSFQTIREHFQKTDAICMLLAFPAIGKGTIQYENSSFLFRGTTEAATTSESVVSANFIGAAMYKKAYLDYVTPDDFSIVPTWSRAIEDGKKVLVYVIDQGFWRDIGTPESLFQIHCDIIDKKIDVAAPETCAIDYNRKICLPKTLAQSERFSRYSWIESGTIPDAIKIDRSVIFSDAQFDPATEIKNSIVTAWGVLPVNE